MPTFMLVFICRANPLIFRINSLWVFGTGMITSGPDLSYQALASTSLEQISDASSQWRSKGVVLTNNLENTKNCKIVDSIHIRANIIIFDYIFFLVLFEAYGTAKRQCVRPGKCSIKERQLYQPLLLLGLFVHRFFHSIQPKLYLGTYAPCLQCFA